jgi:hypothetical protein
MKKNIISWVKTDAPWIETEGFTDMVVDKCSFLSILEHLKIECSECISGTFTHRMRCPLPIHAGGSERTASCYISETNNSFYCFGCIDGKELILTNSGLKKIIDINIGDKVVDKNGVFQKVTNKVIKNKKVSQIEIGSFRYDPLFLTPDHTCFWIKKQDIFSFPFVKKRIPENKHGADIRIANRLNDNAGHDVKVTEGPSKDIEIGDFLLFPIIPKENRKLEILNGENIIKSYTKGPKTKRINRLPVNKNTARLYGLWLAEGSLGRGLIRFTYSIDEKNTFVKETQEILKQEFGLKSSLSIVQEKSTCEVICSKTDLEHLFRFWFGDGAVNKKIPAEAISWPKDIQESLINGYIDGDGITGRKSTITVSKQLAYSLYNISLQAGFQASVSKRSGYIDKNGIRHKRHWVNNIKKRNNIFGFFGKIGQIEYYISPVTKNNITKKTSKVVDISVENTNSFTTKLGVVHNCNSGSSIVDFVRLYMGKPYYEALRWLASFAHITSENLEDLKNLPPKEKKDPEHTVMRFVYKMGILLRTFVEQHKDRKDYAKWSVWADKQFVRLDEMTDRLKDEDWEKVKAYHDKLENYLRSKE